MDATAYGIEWQEVDMLNINNFESATKHDEITDRLASPPYFNAWRDEDYETSFKRGTWFHCNVTSPIPTVLWEWSGTNKKFSASDFGHFLMPLCWKYVSSKKTYTNVFDHLFTLPRFIGGHEEKEHGTNDAAGVLHVGHRTYGSGPSRSYAKIA